MMQFSYMLVFLISITLSHIALSEGKIWALLVAGSNGYYNYRHQADVCHSYQILKHYGVPTENIITMMYDDIAYNKENPNKGEIINQPGGKNVYSGVVIDYGNETVTPKNFINVLSGNNKAMAGIGSGRVIESGPDDIVFVNFVDHGGAGILCFPFEDLTVKDLNKTLTNLYNEKRFNKLILNVEACQSGSMFDNILVDYSNIFVMTAADPRESSYACYYDDDRGTYLGDLFSVQWMQESERENLKAHSLNHLFEIVRTGTTKSHVEEYGDLDIGNTLISDVLGSASTAGTIGTYDTYVKNSGKDAVESPQVPIQILTKKLHKLEMTNRKSEAALVRAEIKSILERRHLVENIMDELVFRIARKNFGLIMNLRDTNYSINKENIDCYDVVVKEFSKTCFKIAKNPFVSTQLHVLVNACTLLKNKENKIVRDIQYVCGKLGKMTNIV